MMSVSQSVSQSTQGQFMTEVGGSYLAGGFVKQSRLIATQ